MKYTRQKDRRFFILRNTHDIHTTILYFTEHDNRQTTLLSLNHNRFDSSAARKNEIKCDPVGS